MQICTYLEHMSHQTAALCEAMDSQRDMLAAIIDGIDGYVDTLKRTLATVRELADNMRSNYRYTNTHSKLLLVLSPTVIRQVCFIT